MQNKVHIPGIPDREFIRGDVPMTKEEVRALTLCKAKVQSGEVVYDIGAGTGSISVEAALMTPEGVVYAIERDEEGVALIQKNAERFGVTNIHIVHGSAPEAALDLPPVDVAIVGGSGGNLQSILTLCGEKMKKGGRILINAVTLETVSEAQTFFASHPEYRVDITCAAITKPMRAGNSHLFRAHNPVFIFAAIREEEV